MNENNCQGENIIIQRVVGARRLRLSVNRQGRVIVRMPFLCPKRLALQFVSENRDWIERQKEKRSKGLFFRDGMSISVLGQAVIIRHCPEERLGTCIRGKELLVSGDDDFLNRRVCDFVKRQTALYIDKKARALAGQIGYKINRISMKDTTSRWGSCSGKCNLNFCWRLGMAPLYVLDYIIAHEVAHLAEMNHSPQFWQVVGRLCDRRADAEIWLRRWGHTLR